MKKSTTILSYLFTITIHVFFWIVIYFFYNYFLGYGSRNTNYVSRFSLYLMPVTIVVGYFFIYYLIPNFLLKKKQVLFVLYSIYTFIVSFFFIIHSVLFGLVFSNTLIKENYKPISKSIIFIVLGVYFVIFIAICVSLIIHNYKESIKNEDLKNKFLHTQLQLKEQELKFLKMQIHPHFLFNTLNTLYGFALKKAVETPEMILKLSNLLDYILYQTDKPAVLLQDEINHLEDYIALEKMRFQNSLEIDFDTENCNKEIQVPPMLFIPFVENSFKHGGLINGKIIVQISFFTDENNLIFKVKNSVQTEQHSAGGIGLENIKKRLNLLYPKAHQLTIKQENQQFYVELTISTNKLKKTNYDKLN